MKSLYTFSLPLKRTVLWKPKDSDTVPLYRQFISCNFTDDEKQKLFDIITSSGHSYRYSIYTYEWILDNRGVFIEKSEFVTDPSCCIAYIYPNLDLNDKLTIQIVVNTDLMEDSFGCEYVDKYLSCTDQYNICNWLYNTFYRIPVFIPKRIMNKIRKV